MKRSVLWCVVLSCAGAGRLHAQGLTMQMSNGWMFSFSGNVNAFWMFTDGKVNTPGAIDGGLVPAEKISRIRTGLLPGFATFSATGKEGGLDLGVHFGFAPQINSNNLHDNFGAQIDMRQVFLTVGGSWGQIEAGRDIGLYQRQNILTDMTLYGTGASGGGTGPGGSPGAAGTTLGRIGFGYVYPNFNAQVTYSTPAGKPAQLSVGLFDPSFIVGPNVTYSGTRLPRLEAELTWTGNLGTSAANAGQMGTNPNKIMVWVNGMLQNTYTSVTPVDGDSSITAAGIGGGVKVDASGFSVVGSGYYGSGIGTTLMFGQSCCALDAAGAKRNTYGYIGQVTYTIPATKWLVGASYGDSRVNSTDNDPADPVNSTVKSNRSIDALVNYQWTKSLRWVAEYTFAKSEAFSSAENSSNQVTSGFMLFF